MTSHLEVEAAIAGQGVLLISADVVESEVQAGRLVRLSDVGFRQGSYQLLHGEGVLRRKSARVFREWLMDETARWRDPDADSQPFS